MNFEETRLRGAYLVDLDKREDQRGFFARAFCQHEFGAHNLETQFVQGNVSYNRSAGTLRGLHYQVAPHEEVKLVRCISGAIYDVIVDLRQGSPTVGQWTGVELSARNRRMLYVPRGFAHGYLTLVGRLRSWTMRKSCISFRSFTPPAPSGDCAMTILPSASRGPCRSRSSRTRMPRGRGSRRIP